MVWGLVRSAPSGKSSVSFVPVPSGAGVRASVAGSTVPVKVSQPSKPSSEAGSTVIDRAGLSSSPASMRNSTTEKMLRNETCNAPSERLFSSGVPTSGAQAVLTCSASWNEIVRRASTPTVPSAVVAG